MIDYKQLFAQQLVAELLVLVQIFVFVEQYKLVLQHKLVVVQQTFVLKFVFRNLNRLFEGFFRPFQNTRIKHNPTGIIHHFHLPDWCFRRIVYADYFV